MNQFLKSMPKDKRQKLILVSLFSLMGVVTVGYLFVGAQLSAMSAGKKKIADLTDKLQQANKAAASESLNSQQRERLQTFVGDQQARMISGDPFSWVVREISLIAEKHPVRVTSLRPGGKTVGDPKATFGEYGAQLEVEAAYDNLGAFIADLENTFSSGEIRSLQVTAADPTRAERHVTIDLALLIRPETPGEKTAPATAQKSEPKAKS